jgi:hypothetical protein
LQSWGIGLLFYPGLVFAMAVWLAGEWMVDSLRPMLTPRLYRIPTRHRHFLQPLYDFFKLAGRRRATPDQTWSTDARPNHALTGLPANALQFACVLAPLLALALLPLPGSAATPELGGAGDLITVLALLVAQPLAVALTHMSHGGLPMLRGAQDIGRLLTGLVPALVAVGALAEASFSRSLLPAELTAAPQTPTQTLVRLLAAAVLLLSLPWWVGRSTVASAFMGAGDTGAGAYLGMRLQAVALAAVWSLLVLPTPGELAWALAVTVGGTLFAFTTMRLVSERVEAARRERDAANLTWATALPVALLALGLAIWPGV